MVDHLVDTNVLIVASAAAPPGFEDVPVGADEVKLVFDWLTTFRDDPSRRLVLDELFRIFDEYRNKLDFQHYGLQVVHAKLERCLRTVPVEYDADGHGVVPAGLRAIDDSDKKFVAAALRDPASISIVNATDSDWSEHREALRAHGVAVEELLG
ncbi:MAG: hypothetical protein OZ921_13050 [Sorangiineae bacterium]|nr:hypothetical protein [Polyangiaceae bacterium]MEB2323436.1 hypothetical protein [Sorangiineae bacterium]